MIPVWNIFARIRARIVRKTALANAESAFRQAQARYIEAHGRHDTRDMHHAHAALMAAQNERLRVGVAG